MRGGEFLIDHDVADLNHGSYGACTTAVLDEYQRFQRELLAVPKAIEVHSTFDLAGCRSLADLAERRLGERGLPRIAGEPAPFMRAVELPAGDADALRERLYNEIWSTLAHLDA